MSGPQVKLVKNFDCSLGEGPHWDETNQTLLFVDIDQSAVHRWNPEQRQLKTVYCPGPQVKLVKNFDCSLGEGPHWDETNQTLLFVDIDQSAVHRWNPEQRQLKTVYCPDPTVGAVVPRKGGGLVIAADHRFAFLDEETSNTETIAQVQLEVPKSRFNDGKCDPAGRFWAGTMGVDEVPGVVGKKRGRLHCLDTEGNVSTKLSNVDLSNGLSWSADNSVMYYTDSFRYCIDAYDYNVTTGTIDKPRVVTKFSPTIEGVNVIPDGHCIDADGNLWVSIFYAGQIIKVDPKTGQHVQFVRVSDCAVKTTSVCFGGKNMDEMYVTSARNEPLKSVAGGDISGALFKVTNLGVKGVKANVYGG